MRRWIERLWDAMPPLGQAGMGVCLLLVALALLLKALGASWVNVAFAVVPLAVTSVLVAATPRLHGLTRPRPKLTLAVDGADDGQLVAGGLPPWPLDAQRIVDNETAEALDTIRNDGAALSVLGIGLASRPTPEDHQRAQDQFRSEVASYAEKLSKWLEEYAQAALARWETFEVSLTLANARGAAHAEAVEVVLELPDTVTQESATSVVDAPPERPAYVPPQPRPLWGAHVPMRGPSYVRPALEYAISSDDLVLAPRPQETWDDSRDGRRLEAPRVDLQPDRTVEIAEPLSLRARGPGVHEVRWIVYSHSLNGPVRGSFVLVVPEGDPQRPPFGRLEGILRYPDAPIATKDDEGDESAGGEEPVTGVRRIRVDDPPLASPPAPAGADGGIRAKLQAAVRHGEWRALGLNPALDGPSSDRTRVEEARPDQPNE